MVDRAGDRRGEASALVAAASRWALGAFFRRIEVVGLDKVPAEGPVLFVANHNNALVDPLLLLGWLPRRPRFLAKSTLWRVPGLGPLLDWGGAIPVYRRQDGPVAPGGNDRMFERCHELLAVGGAVAIFPEGQSHDEASLSPLRTGAARIVLGAEARQGPHPIRVVPVGLVFEDKERFRSRALMVIGDPVDGVGEGGDDPVRELTRRIEERLRAVTHDWSSWDEARWAALAAQIAARPAPEPLPSPLPLEAEFSRSKLFATGYRELLERDPGGLQVLRRELARYDRLLRFFGLRDDQVAATWAPRPILLYLARTVLAQALRLPFAVVGTVLCVAPYWLCDLSARHFAEARDEVATYKVYPGLLLYPLCWIGQALLVALVWGRWWGVATGLLAPFGAWVALDFTDRRRLLWREARAFFRLRRGSLGRELLERRAEVAAALAEAIARHSDSVEGRGAAHPLSS